MSANPYLLVPTSSVIVETYTYDNNGNRVSATINGTTTTVSYTLDDNLVVYGDNTYLYDDDGYLQTKTTPEGTTTYSYGTMGELLSVTTPTKSISYKHNANNQRVAKLVNGEVVEKYLWANLTTLLAVYDKKDNLVQRFEYADNRMPVAMTDANGNRYYLHYDQVGSLRAVTDTSHNIIKEITYDTFGNILTDSNPDFKVPFGFAGGLYDSDTKLTRFGYRDYDAYTGKWTAKDPIGFQGGDSNLYGYVLGDPVDFTDSFGLKPPQYIPKNTSLCKNGKEAKKMSPLDFYKAVKSGGKWDYKRKNRKYENFGNYNFGYTAAAFGIPRGIGKFGAGMYQLKSGTSSWSYYNTFFDDPNDQKWINEGYDDYANDYYQCQDTCK